MGTKNNPGNYDCYANAEPNEPMFVLLGRDRYAGELVREWANARQRAANRSVLSTVKEQQQIDEAFVCADEMDRWCRSLKKAPATLAKPQWFVAVKVGSGHSTWLCYAIEEVATIVAKALGIEREAADAILRAPNAWKAGAFQRDNVVVYDMN